MSPNILIAAHFLLLMITLRRIVSTAIMTSKSLTKLRRLQFYDKDNPRIRARRGCIVRDKHEFVCYICTQRITLKLWAQITMFRLLHINARRFYARLRGM